MPDILNCRVDALDFTATVQRACEIIEQNRFAVHSSVNASKVVKMETDAMLRRAVLESDLASADGMPIVWVSKLLGTPVPERVAGCDLFPALVKAAAERGYPVYFLGARREVLDELIGKYQKLYPALKLAGSRDGYFKEAEEAEVARAIGQSGARLLFIAMPTPRKEIFIERHKAALGPCFCMGVGGSFDVEAGRVKRAPLWMQKAGLEWFWRTLQEPRKMWKRYAVTIGSFGWLTVRGLWRRVRGQPQLQLPPAD